MKTETHAEFATELGHAELESQEKLSFKVPYLSVWADKQVASQVAC